MHVHTHAGGMLVNNVEGNIALLEAVIVVWHQPMYTPFCLSQLITRLCLRCDDALQQNEVTNIFEDDFAFLGDDDGGNGNRKENTISEYQSFTDLQHSKGRVVSAIHWLPHRKV